MTLRDVLLGPRDPGGAPQAPPPPAAFAGDQVNAQAVDPPGNPLERHIERMTMHMANLERLVAAQLAANRVLFSGTRTVDAGGHASLSFPVTYASVFVDNSDGPADVVVASSPPQGAAPGTGPGVWIIPAGATRTVPLAGRVLTVYGTSGQTVGLVVGRRPVDPAAAPSAGGSAGSLAAPVQVPEPAAGADWTYTVTEDSALYLVAATLTTGADSPSNVFLTLDGALIGVTNNSFAADTAYQMAFGDSGVVLSSTNYNGQSAFGGGFPLPAGSILASMTEGATPGQWSTIQLFLQPWGA